MPKILLLLLFIVTAISCDCLQKASGVVLDSQTRKPLEKVSLGQFETVDTSNPYSKRIATDKSGQFNYSNTGGGFRKCPDLKLYFSKKGYKTSKIVFPSNSSNDTVLLEKIPINRDSFTRISLSEFDQKIDASINLLKNKSLKEISNEEHIEIMMCLNTIFIQRYKDGHYDELLRIVNEKKYTRDITKVYPDWIPNRGMGFYFPSLNMELYGTPSPYAVYEVQ